MRAGTYSGRPIEAHKFGGLTEAHFRQWATVFTNTVNDVFTASVAALFIELAKRMASSIAMRIGVGRLSFYQRSQITRTNASLPNGVR